MEALTLLESCAGEFGAEILKAGTRTTTVALNLRRASGASVRYHLQLGSREREVSVRELEPRRLPAHCPERHINGDGTFCTHWAEGDPRPVVDLDSARAWWALLWAFLERQEAAAQLRKFPGATRAHGAAADHQAKAERIAQGFGDAFLQALIRDEFDARRTMRRGRSRIELLRGEAFVNRLALPGRVLSHPDAPCPCEPSAGAVPIGQCGTHQVELAQLIEEVYRWHKLEEEFNRDLKKSGFECCGTLRNCPFA